MDGTSKLEVGKNIRNYLIELGEPLQFGVEDGKIVEFLSNMGFKNIRNVTGGDYKKYFGGKYENREVCDLLSFARAVVK